MATAKNIENDQETPIRRSLRNASKPKFEDSWSLVNKKSETIVEPKTVPPSSIDDALLEVVSVKEDEISKESQETSNNEEEEEEEDEDDDEMEDGMDFPANSNMSLDVLARVATETLDKFKSTKPSPHKKVQKKAVQVQDSMTLSQIQKLSDKVLVSLFSELSPNEMSRNYTFTCYLLPRECKEKFTSFGNESRARSLMCTHLLKHVEKLVAEADDPNKTPGETEFTAQTVPGRRRQTIEMAKSKKNRGNLPFMKARKTDYTSLKPFKSSLTKTSKTSKLGSLGSLGLKAVKPMKPVKPRKISPKKLAIKLPKKSPPVEQVRVIEVDNSEQITVEEISDISEFITIKDETAAATFPSLYQEEAERRIEENEQFIIELLCRTQPHHDHSYTTIFGKKRGIDSMVTSDSEDEAVEDEPYALEIPASSPAFPMLLFSCDLVPPPDIGPVASQEVIIEDMVMMPVSVVTPQYGQDSYPLPHLIHQQREQLIPKRKAPLIVFNQDTNITMPVPRKQKPVDNMGATEYERRLALRCINELRTRRKEDHEPLACKICPDRVFTAAATLTYHYRSHAGIKPFVCLICNTTFTRQHSLNYHMLIHNNQSRFQCKDCGRRFRHPSHYKEHMRRHTGETPYVCTDCTQRFKTRNTFKRHLKTRHGKLLTAGGISSMNVPSYDDQYEYVRIAPPTQQNEYIRINPSSTGQHLIYLNAGIAEAMDEQCQESEVQVEDIQECDIPEGTEIHEIQVMEMEQEQGESCDEDELAANNIDLLATTEDEAKAVLVPIINM